MTLRALVIPGIQNTEEDWADLRYAMDSVVDLSIAPPSVSADTLEYGEWRERTIQKESETIRSSFIQFLIGHSFGTHRIPELMDRNPQIEGAVLITPARNQIENSDCRPVLDIRQSDPIENADGSWERTDAATAMQKLLWNLTLEMSDQRFFPFAERHTGNYRINRKSINRQLQFLENGPTIQERLTEKKSSKPILVIQAPNELWHPGMITPDARTTVVAMNSNTGHYPHTSKPFTTAGIIKSWIQAVLVKGERAREMADAA